MHTIVMTSQKGGSGKTTINAHLAVAAEQAGDGPTVIMDADPQGTLATWWRQRAIKTPQLAPTNAEDLTATIATLAQMGFQQCLIDTPPALTKQNHQLVELADLVLIPTRPSPADLWALGKTLELVSGTRRPFLFVLTQAKSRARISRQSLTALAEHGEVAKTVLHDRVDFAQAMTDGRTAIEINPKGTAAAEVKALWREVRTRMREEKDQEA